jgi:hypothetical protein
MNKSELSSILELSFYEELKNWEKMFDIDKVLS